MSTASVVRDMISILDAFSQSEEGSKVENPSLLNFWGFSYGSFLGQTFASMFPDRVGRVVLDGVLDAEDYVTGSFLSYLTDADEVFSTFFLYCHLAGPSKCSFYTGNTSHDIFLRFESMLSRLNSTYALEQGWQNATQMDSFLRQLRWNVIFENVYEPISYFPLFATWFSALDASFTNASNTTNVTNTTDTTYAADTTLDDIEDIISTAADMPSNGPNVQGDGDTPWAILGVVCTDNGGALYNLSSEALMPRFKTFLNQSYLGGWNEIDETMECVKWPSVTKYRYAGNIVSPSFCSWPAY